MTPIVRGAQACSRCREPVKIGSAGKLCPACVMEVMLQDDGEDADSTTLCGQIFAGYELVEEIGRGGTGLVYRARQMKLNRPVALKLLSGGIFAGAEAVRRFRAEAELAAGLDHPNIVRILEVGEHDGHEFFSMALVEGPPLSQFVGANGMSPRGASQLLVKIARAAQFAHDRGILHRDIKPGNVLLDSRGEPHLTDFGIAKILEQDSTLTRTNSILGTPAYMAPEQARGDHRALTVATDIYALGALLYFCLTGSAPFGGGTTLETVRQLLDKEPRSPRLLNPHVDLDLAAVCLKSLEKEPALRYASAAAFAEDLERWIQGEPTVARPATAMGKARKWAVRHPAISALSAALMLASAAGAGGVFWQWRQAERGWQAALQARSETLQESYFSSIALAQRYIDEGDIPRARHLLLGVPEHYRNWEWGRLVCLCFQEVVALPGLQDPAAKLAWAHDGSGILAKDGEAIRKWKFPAGTEVFGVDDSNAAAFSKSPVLGSPNLLAKFLAAGEDPKQILSAAADSGGTRFAVLKASGEIVVGEPAGAGPIRSFSVPANSVVSLVLSPNGQVLAGLHKDRTMHIWDATTFREIDRDPSRVYAADFSPDSTLLATWGGDRVVRLLDPTTGQELKQLFCGAEAGNVQFAFSSDSRFIATSATGEPIRIYEAVNRKEHFDHEIGFKKVAIDRSGTRMAAAHRTGQASIWDLGAAELVTDRIGNLQWCLNVAFSPAENRLLTVGADQKARIWNLDTLAEEHALPHGAAVFAGAWNLSGEHVITGDWKGRISSWDSRTGTLLASRATEHGAILGLAVSGSNLVAAAHRDGTATLWTGDALEFAKAIQCSRGPVTALAFTPHSKMLLTGGFDRRITSWTLDRADQPEALLAFGSVFSLQFSPDGQRLLSTSSGRLTGLEGPAIQLWDLRAGREVITFKYPPGQITAAAFSPDGSRIVSGLESSGLWNGSFGIQLESFPCAEREYPGPAGQPLEERITAYARNYWRARAAARPASEAQNVKDARVPLEWPARSPSFPAECLDLTPSYNAFLDFPWWPLSTWSEFDDGLTPIETGFIRPKEIAFDVRGLMVSAPPGATSWKSIPLYREALRPISVHACADVINFLHATTLPASLGAEVGAYQVDYENGRSETIALRYGDEILCWSSPVFSDEGCKRAAKIWERRVSPPLRGSRRLFHFSWPNPHPGLRVSEISLKPKSGVAPFVAAVTVSKARPAFTETAAHPEADR